MADKMLFRWRIGKGLCIDQYFVEVEQKQLLWWERFCSDQLEDACIAVSEKDDDSIDFFSARNIIQLFEECGGVDIFMKMYIEKVLEEKESPEANAKEKLDIIAAKGWRQIEFENK